MNMQYAQAVVAHEQAQRRRVTGPAAFHSAPRSGLPEGASPSHSDKQYRI
jgi:hypothetical protein